MPVEDFSTRRPMTINAFHGSKVALLCEDRLVVYKRDDVAGLRYPGFWDFPGGGREGSETPEQCVLRELDEEFGLALPASRLRYRRRYESPAARPATYFFVAEIEAVELKRISFGDEGQYWKLMHVDEYLGHPNGIPSLQSRLRDYLSVD